MEPCKAELEGKQRKEELRPMGDEICFPHPSQLLSLNRVEDCTVSMKSYMPFFISAHA